MRSIIAPEADSTVDIALGGAPLVRASIADYTKHFASLATFGVTSVRVFGICLAVGVLSALLIELSFIPACRALLPAPR